MKRAIQLLRERARELGGNRLVMASDALDRLADELEKSEHCRRCSECSDDEHHWMEDMVGEEPMYVCKHCNAIAPMCDECGGLMLPVCCDDACGSLDQAEAES